MNYNNKSHIHANKPRYKNPAEYYKKPRLWMYDLHSLHG